ncbi:fimbrial protein [Klebsiella oxytoca]|uniref:Fimbrial protein n=1 Tax=Klebsiella oxytoca TaxID=571 RepID=A0A6B8MFX7_KLEOX|nr:fimbrial protein [Klebsiella oxytoca]QGN36345.1 fimbrial protein [Klebsiella oxytoca]
MTRQLSTTSWIYPMIVGAILLLSGGQVTAAEGDTTTINITGTLIDGPQCVIDGNDTIDVKFGDDLITRKVDGTTYKKEIQYGLSCTGLTSNALKLTIRGSLSSFGSGLLLTTKGGLGIRLFSGADGNTVLTPGNYVNFNGETNKPKLWAVPVAQDNTTLTAGSFSGTGTMVIEYQ